MKSILIVGGKLQGAEACYLARKAGIRTILVDKDPDVPARGLCDEFLCRDLFEERYGLREAFDRVDLVLPAMENDAVLDWLQDKARPWGFRLAFDGTAYNISSSKTASDRLFRALALPAPAYYPEGQFPYLAKPVSGSGSEGVRVLQTPEVLAAALADPAYPENLIIQEFLEGPSYSLEIIGRPGAYRTYAVTQIHMDDVYDCCRVTTPCVLPPGQDEAFRRMAETLADALDLVGIMDLEVILSGGKLKLLEIDARIPSQTPAAILHSTGVNLLSELYDLFCGTFEGNPLKETRGPQGRVRHAAYEHYLVENGSPRSLGEHIMTQGGALRQETGAWGADETVSDYAPDLPVWRGIFMNAGDTPEELEQKRARTLQALRER